jgi:hypothetical protein
MSQEKNPLDQLSHILLALGQTADEVAGVLRASGCRGFRNGSFPSPVIRYAYRKFDAGSLELVYSAVLKPDNSTALEPNKLYLYLLDANREEMRLPAAVAEFLARFDEGSYPDLNLESSRT